MNLALYREFRPAIFEQVVGQNHITRTLANQVKNKSTTHAYLFTGARGTGKTSCAKIFAKAINCLNPNNGSPCGECEVCKGLSLPNTDVVEIDAASNNRVDEIRDLREKVKYPPIIASKKVYIVDEVHMLTESAFNALLKTLEEPPAHVVFVLATTEVHKLPATILSRCTRFDFRLLTVEELVNHLKFVFSQRGIKSDESSLYLIAGQGAGSVRDTLSIADSVSAFCENDITYDKCLEVLGLTSNEGISKLVDTIIKHDIKGIFFEVSQMLNRGKNISLLCKEMTEYFKNLLLVKNGVDDINTLNIMPNELDMLRLQANVMDEDLIKVGFNKFASIELDLKYSINPQSLFESVCVGLIQDVNRAMHGLSVNTAPALEPAKQENKTIVAPQNISPNINQSNSVINTSPANIVTNPQENIISNQPINEARAETKVEQQSQSMNINNMNIDRLWGNVLVKIKELNMFALSSALRDVYGVHMVGNTLILKTNDTSVLKTIDDPSRLDVILNIATSINSDIKKVEITYDQANKSNKDIVAELKNIFMDKLKVKE